MKRTSLLWLAVCAGVIIATLLIISLVTG